MEQVRLDFSAPITGRSPRARHASRSGAAAQVKVWTRKQSALLQVLNQGAAMTRNELAAVLGWPITSVCSVLWSVREQLESAGLDKQVWDDGRTTWREQFTIKRR